MDKRRFLRAGFAASAAAVSVPALAQASPNVRWRCASSFPKSLDTIYGGGEVLARRVAQITGGKFQISVHAAGDLGHAARQHLAAAVDGVQALGEAGGAAPAHIGAALGQGWDGDCSRRGCQTGTKESTFVHGLASRSLRFVSKLTMQERC